MRVVAAVVSQVTEHDVQPVQSVHWAANFKQSNMVCSLDYRLHNGTRNFKVKQYIFLNAYTDLPGHGSSLHPLTWTASPLHLVLPSGRQVLDLEVVFSLPQVAVQSE